MNKLNKIVLLLLFLISSLSAIKNDFNGDGKADILWKKGKYYSLWYINANGSHKYNYIGKKSPPYKVAGTGDFNGDGKTDILWKKDSKYSLWYMNANGSHKYKYIGKKSSPYQVVGIGDFNGNGKADILWQKGKYYSLWYMSANGKHKYKYIGKKPSTYEVVSVADFNGDGKTDILWKKGNYYSLWYMSANGKHKYKYIGKKPSTYEVVSVSDFNGDGKADILWKKGKYYSFWYMNASGSHKYKYIGKKSFPYEVAGVGDFNGNGKVDILWKKEKYYSFWYMNTSGSHKYKYIGKKPLDYGVFYNGNFNKIKGSGALIPTKEMLSTVPMAMPPLSSYTSNDLPLSFDLSSNMPPVRSQGAQGSCVAWAVGYYLKSYHEHLDKNTNYGDGDDYEGVYSPAFLYNKLKVGSCDGGSYIYQTLEAVRNTGVASWKDMPYIDTNCNAKPSTTAVNHSKCAKILDYKSIRIHKPIETIEMQDMKFYISHGSPLIIGIRIYHGFDNPTRVNGELIYKYYSEKGYRGGHAIVVVGYDDSRNAFKIINSWGTNWGNNGFLWIDYTVFSKIVFEAYQTTDVLNECEEGSSYISIDKQSLLFNKQYIGKSYTKTFKLSNTGSVKLTINDITIPDGYKVNWTSGIIESNSYKKITVTFTPTENKSYNGTLTIESDADKGKKSIKLIGEGIDKINPNHPPIAKAGTDISVKIGTTVTLDASKSSDDGEIISYEWKLGNSILSNSKRFSKSDLNEGIHRITLKVTDDKGLTDIDDIVITVLKETKEFKKLVEYSLVGDYKSIDVDEHYAYVVDKSGLKIFDIINDNIQLISSLTLDGEYKYNILKKNNYLYIANANKGLRIIDINDIYTPKLVGTFYTGSDDWSGSVENVDVKGDYAYIAYNGGGALNVIDITNKTSPHLIDNYGDAGMLVARVYNNYIYVDDFSGDGGIFILKLQNNKIIFIGKYNEVGAYIRDIAIEKNYAYVLVNNVGVRILDIKDKSNPKLINTIKIDDNNIRLELYDKYLIVSSSNYNGIKIIDISDKNNPMVLKEFNSYGGTIKTKTINDKIYLIDREGIKIFGSITSL